MVAGKVRVAMGLQKSPSPARTKPEPPPKPPSPPVSSGKSSQKAVFSRSFGVYFPRSSAQVQPKPPDVAELLRLVEELRERESRLKTELLEHKLLKESVAIVPVLENEIFNKDEEIAKAKRRIEALENENCILRSAQDLVQMKREEERRENEKKVEVMEAKIKAMEAEISEMKKAEKDRIESEELSSSQRFQGLMEVSVRSNLIKNLKKGVKCTDISANLEMSRHKLERSDSKREEVETEIEMARHSRCNSEDFAESTLSTLRSRVPRVPKPPPRPSSSSSSNGENKPSTPEQPANIPPPPPPPPSQAKVVPPPPPPPSRSAPPPPPKGRKTVTEKVRRVPEVVEFYHSLMRRDSRRDSGTGASDAPATTNARDMIGEIENRSAHLLAVSFR